MTTVKTIFSAVARYDGTSDVFCDSLNSGKFTKPKMVYNYGCSY